MVQIFALPSVIAVDEQDSLRTRSTANETASGQTTLILITFAKEFYRPSCPSYNPLYAVALIEKKRTGHEK